MATIGKYRAEFTADSRGFRSGMGRIRREMSTTASAGRSFTAAFRRMGAALLAAVSVRAIARQARESVQAFAVQERAVVQLASALESFGRGGTANLKLLTDEAARLQRVFAAADEEIIAATATLSKLAPALNVDQLRQAQTLLVGLADTFFDGKIDAAAVQLGKSLGSTVNSLSRYGIQVDTTADAAGRLEQILASDSLQAAIEGAAASAQTLEGRTQSLRNSFGDFQEALGQVVTGVLGLRDNLGGDAGLRGIIDRATNSILANMGAWVAYGRIAVGAIKAVFDTFNAFYGVIVASSDSLVGVLVAMEQAVRGNFATAAAAIRNIPDEFDGAIARFRAAGSTIAEVFDNLVNFDDFADSLSESLLDFANSLATATAGAAGSVAGDVEEELGAVDKVLADVVSDGIDRLARFSTQGKDAFRDFVDSAIENLQRLALQMAALELINAITPEDSRVGNVLRAAVGAPTGGSGGGSGSGAASSTPPPSSGQIAGAGAASMNVTFNIQALDSKSVNDLLDQNRGAVVNALRRAVRSSESARLALR